MTLDGAHGQLIFSICVGLLGIAAIAISISRGLREIRRAREKTTDRTRRCPSPDRLPRASGDRAVPSKTTSPPAADARPR